MMRPLETAAVAVLAVERFSREWLRCGALPTALGRSMTAGTNCSNLLQSSVLSRMHVRRALGGSEFACSI